MAVFHYLTVYVNQNAYLRGMGLILFFLFGIGLIYLIVHYLRYFFGPTRHEKIMKANDDFVKSMRELEKKNKQNND